MKIKGSSELKSSEMGFRPDCYITNVEDAEQVT